MAKDRVALVTGAASGIGEACARALAERGDCSVAVVDLPRSRGAEVAAELGGIFVPVDLSRRDGCREAVERTVRALGVLDIIVNNAGLQHMPAIPYFPEEAWDRLIALMLTAPFLLSKYAWEYLARSGQGRIINIGSAHSLTASPFKSAYVTAKHGLLGFTKTAALEGAQHGITCNTVCPAYVRTPLVEKQIADQARTRGIAPEEVEEQVFLEKTAIKRMLEPADVARYVLFLASPEAWGITGSAQEIDLGWTAA